VDPLATLAFVAGVTERIGLGTGVLDLPYRPALPTAKWLASIQALSEGRLHLGVGVGWMEAEFQALGVDRARRGAITDETLAVLHRCFADDEVELNGQRFLFLPRPARPPIYVGGRSPQALRRAATLGDGWFPNMAEPDELRAPIEELRRLAREAGKPTPEVVLSGRVALDDAPALRDRIAAFTEIGVTGIAVSTQFENAAEFGRNAEFLARANE
jgi:probable F420-dependent oxidoreductase